jgi:hypothetical protein
MKREGAPEPGEGLHRDFAVVFFIDRLQSGIYPFYLEIRMAAHRLANPRGLAVPGHGGVDWQVQLCAVVQDFEVVAGGAHISLHLGVVEGRKASNEMVF